MRHNRTLLALGKTAHQKIQNSHICVLGANPLGTDIISTFLLFGVNKISVFDNSIVSSIDHLNNMFVLENDIGKTRSSVICKSLQKLNPNASIISLDKKPTENDIKNFSFFIISSQISFPEICEYNVQCRNNDVGFALVDSYSFSGFVFIDFGDSFIVDNLTGKKIERFRIQQISNSNPAVIRFVGKEMPKLPKDSFIKFQGLSSMTELNNIEKVCLHIEEGIATIDCDTTHFSKFDRFNPNGFAIQVEDSIIRNFKKYSETLDSPFYSIHFTDQHKIVRSFFLNRQKNEYIHFNIDSFYIPATTSLIAGVVSNECIKYLTKCLNPMTKQWFLYNCDDLFDPSSKTTKIDYFNELQNLNIAIVGVGATGCQAAKFFSLSKLKSLTLIDSDSIETTNLNRQILFSDDDIGKNKADAAASTIHSFNSKIKLKTYPHFINEETKSIFTDSWFSQFDAIFSMVDSYTARIYIEKRCAPLKIPNFTGGISKTTADWQTFVPNFTPRYNTIVPNDNKSSFGAPSCTLKLFPHRPEHCIEWAHHQLNRVLHRVQKHKMANFEECINYACDFFISKFDYKIRDLQYFHPKDEEVNGIKGLYYWSNHRIYPNVVNFDPNDSKCQMLIHSLVFLLAEACQIKCIQKIDYNDLNEKVFIRKSREWKPPDDSHRKSFEDVDDDKNSPLIDDLFLHDDEVHIDFIYSCSNLRSMNYGLGEIDRLYAQSYAGKIETAVSTTAAICSASLFIEFLVSRIAPEKLCRGKYSSSPFSYMTFREPEIPKKKFGNTNSQFTTWDFLNYNGNQTFSEVQNDIEIKANAKLFSWTTEDGKILPVKGQKCFGPKISVDSTFDSVFDQSIESVQIEATFEFINDDEIQIPPIIIHLSHK